MQGTQYAIISDIHANPAALERVLADAERCGAEKVVCAGDVVYFILRNIAGKIDGCLIRMLVKTIGFIAYALGVGLLLITFFMEGEFKKALGVDDGKIDFSTADEETRMTEKE